MPPEAAVIGGPEESAGPSGLSGALAGPFPGAGEVASAEAVGTCTIAPHWGQAARLPAALAATLSVRWQLVQLNSRELAAWVGVVLMRLGQKGKKFAGGLPL